MMDEERGTDTDHMGWPAEVMNGRRKRRPKIGNSYAAERERERVVRIEQILQILSFIKSVKRKPTDVKDFHYRF